MPAEEAYEICDDALEYSRGNTNYLLKMYAIVEGTPVQ